MNTHPTDTPTYNGRNTTMKPDEIIEAVREAVSLSASWTEDCIYEDDAFLMVEFGRYGDWLSTGGDADELIDCHLGQEYREHFCDRDPIIIDLETGAIFQAEYKVRAEATGKTYTGGAL